MVTRENICNFALSRIGGSRLIGSYDENTAIAKLCRLWYDQSRQFCLTSLGASFARARANIAQESTIPEFGWAYKYKLPDKFLDILAVGGTTKKDNFCVEGEFILTDYAAPLKLWYIKDIEETHLFDPGFVELLSLILAKNICIDLTQDYKKQQYLEGLCKVQSLKASYKYARENKNVITMDSKNSASQGTLNKFNVASFNGELK